MSYYCFEQVVTFVAMSLLSDIHIFDDPGFDRSLVPSSLPSSPTCKKLLQELAAIVYLAKISKLHIATDKSDRV
jgi:hypothetical protein